MAKAAGKRGGEERGQPAAAWARREGTRVWAGRCGLTMFSYPTKLPMSLQGLCVREEVMHKMCLWTCKGNREYCVEMLLFLTCLVKLLQQPLLL